jgi:DNA-directed RNA polymerases I, II, and III subunit RPABC2
VEDGVGYYDVEEQDDELPPEPELDADALEERAQEGAENGDEERTVVTGDPNRTAQKPAKDQEKKIPDDKRTTTPYMTKYERARVLGTRALQLR